MWTTVGLAKPFLPSTYSGNLRVVSQPGAHAHDESLCPHKIIATNPSEKGKMGAFKNKPIGPRNVDGFFKSKQARQLAANKKFQRQKKTKARVRHLVNVGGKQFVVKADQDSLPQNERVDLSFGMGGVSDCPSFMVDTDSGAPKQLKGSITGVAANLGSIAHALSTGNRIVDTMLSGLSQPNSNMPDPFSMARSFDANCFNSIQINPVYPSSGTTTYGGRAIVMTGSGAYSLLLPTCTGSASSVTLAYNGGSNYSCGLASADFYTRPKGFRLNLHASLVGPVHKIIVRAFPLQPLNVSVGTLAALPTGWPSACEGALTNLHASWGGREWSLGPGEDLDFVTVPMDSRGFSFMIGNTSRLAASYDGPQSWGGWLIWWWGLTSGDYVQVHTTMAEEHIIKSEASTAYVYPTKYTDNNPTLAAKAKNLFANVISKGYGAYKYIAESPLTPMVAGLAANMLAGREAISRLDLGLTQNSNPVGVYSTTSSMQGSEEKHNGDTTSTFMDEKEQEKTSFRSSSSSSSGQRVDSDTPRGGLDRLVRAGRVQ